jgi:hypothetical protein
VRVGIFDRRVAVLAAALVATAVACTHGVTADLSNAGEVDGVTRAVTVTSTPPSTTVAASSTLPAAASVLPSSRPHAITATTTTAPPAFAHEFASAIAQIEVQLLRVPVSISTRDSVARLWLLVGRPPTAAELRTAVTAVVRDGVPLDAIATLLLDSSDGAVAQTAAPPEQFVADLYQGVVARRGTPREVAAWVRGLRDGMSAGDVAVALAESPEAVKRSGTVAHESLAAVAVPDVPRPVSDSVLRLYLGLLVRLPTADELDRSVDRYTAGELLSTIADDILQSAEYLTRRPAGDPASVLAGLFEDVLDTRPTHTVVAGWAHELGRSASAADVAVAFTESAAAVARTTTAPPVAPNVTPSLPSTVAITPGHDILAVGDSVMLGAASALTRQFPGITIDAAVGRQFLEGVAITKARAARGAIPATVIVHLGTNGAVGQRSCDELMDVLAGKRVVLVNVHVPRPWEAPTNEVLAACAARHGATVVDWHTDAVGLAPDGYHLGARGPDAFAALIAAQLA